MKLLTNYDLQMAIRHAMAECDRVSVKQPRKRYDAYYVGLWDGVRLYNDGNYSGEIVSGDMLLVKVNKNLGTKKYPDVHEAYITVFVEKVCEKIIKCTDGDKDYCVYPDAVLAIVRGWENDIKRM